jgi:hypothetical protein
MDGITPGIPKKMHKPIADGIVTGIKKDMAQSIQPMLTKCAPSATQSSVGVFGAGRTPEGDGNAKGGGMKLAHNADGMLKKKMKKAMEVQKHEDLHNM